MYLKNSFKPSKYSINSSYLFTEPYTKRSDHANNCTIVHNSCPAQQFIFHYESLASRTPFASLHLGYPKRTPNSISTDFNDWLTSVYNKRMLQTTTEIFAAKCFNRKGLYNIYSLLPTYLPTYLLSMAHSRYNLYFNDQKICLPNTNNVGRKLCQFTQRLLAKRRFTNRQLAKHNNWIASGGTGLVVMG